MNKKGQALVEFIIILPIFLLLIMGIVDLGRICYTKMNLEENLNFIIDIYNKNKNMAEIKDKLNIDIDIKNDNEYTNFLVTKKLNIITPGLNLILDNPYIVKSERSILNE